MKVYQEKRDASGQIIATSHGSLSPNGGFVRKIPLFPGNLGEGEIL